MVEQSSHDSKVMNSRLIVVDIERLEIVLKIIIGHFTLDVRFRVISSQNQFLRKFLEICKKCGFYELKKKMLILF